MIFVKDGDRIIVKYNGESLDFGEGIPRIRTKTMEVDDPKTGKKIHPDKLVFLEINDILSDKPKEDLDRLWEVYQIASELLVEPVEVKHQNAESLVREIVDILPPELYTDRYPRGSLWCPDGTAGAVEDIEANHTRTMTFIKDEYHDLIILSLFLRPLIPIMSMMGVYGSGSDQSTGKRLAVDNRYRLMDVFERMAFMSLPILARLNEYVPEVVRHSLKKTEGQYNSPNLYLTAGVVGHGSDALDTYFISYILFNLIPFHVVGQKYQDTHMGTSLVVRMFIGIETECVKSYNSRVSEYEVSEKMHAMKHTIGGEESKLSVIDIVGARSKTPMEEWIIEEEHIHDYRQFIKAMAVEMSPSETKMYIDNALASELSHYDTMHVFLIGLALQQPMGDVRNVHDLGNVYFEHAIGIAQAYYQARGFTSLARLLSCYSTPEHKLGDYPFKPIEPTLKEKIARYYPQEYHTTKNQRVSCPALLSIQTFMKRHLNQRVFTTKVTSHEVAARLNVPVGEAQYRPTEDTICELAEAMYMQARAMWRYVNPEIENYI